MKEILFISSQQHFVAIVEQNFIMESMDVDYNLTCKTSAGNLAEDISKFKPDLVVLSYDILKTKPSWEVKNTELAFLARSDKELQEGAGYGIKTIGIARTAKEVVEKLSKIPYAITAEKKTLDEKKSEDPAKTSTKAITKKAEPKKTPNKHIDSMELEDFIESKTPKMQQEEKKSENENTKKSSAGPGFVGGYGSESFMSGYGDISGNISPSPKEEYLEELMDEDDDKPVAESGFPELDFDYESSSLPQYLEDLPEEADSQNEKSSEEIEESRETEENKAKANTPIRSVRHADTKKTDQKDYIEEAFRHDLRKDKSKTKVITVYSAKGGVGKTTIASELATYLSLVSVGQRKLRVCLVDYNIDFGNVWATLSLKQGGSNLAYWAMEIQEFLQKDKILEDIHYTRAEIEEYLQKDKKSGLYILPAPFTHEDSMSIESETLGIILYNLIEYGEFDYIICDTGNNTRDSTMIALEYADIILLIMTQNINTAFCDRAFMKTMDSIDFDLSNTKLIINYIMPQKSTGMSVQEIVEYFPFDCVGKIRFNADIIKATNDGVPLAYNPEHDFTKQMRSIVSYILQDNEFEVEQKQKKKFFQFLFSNKK